MRALNDYIQMISKDIKQLSGEKAASKYLSFSIDLIRTQFISNDNRFKEISSEGIVYDYNGTVYFPVFSPSTKVIDNTLKKVIENYGSKLTNIVILQMSDAVLYQYDKYSMPLVSGNTVNFQVVYFKDIIEIARSNRKMPDLIALCENYFAQKEFSPKTLSSDMSKDTFTTPVNTTRTVTDASIKTIFYTYIFCKNTLPRKLENLVIYLQIQLRATLEEDDDWDEYLSEEKDFFFNVFLNDEGHEHFIGRLQIIDTKTNYSGLKEWIKQEKHINQIPRSYLSIGDASYYWNLRKAPFFREALKGLRDLAFGLPGYKRSTNPSVQQLIKDKKYLEKYKRIARGEAELTNYYFTYWFPDENISGTDVPKIPFVIDQTVQLPPSNVHVLIGANGSGKTTVLRQIASLALETNPPKGNGKLVFEKETSIGRSKKHTKKTLRAEKFTNALYISYSFFDAAWEMKKLAIKYGDNYKYIGLESKEDTERTQVSLDHLKEDFKATFEKICHDLEKSEQWEETLNTVSSNSSFSEFEQFRIRNTFNENAYSFTAITEAFSHLSAGHKSVILTLLKLIDLVEENTLVLFDEPEEHLHPPLVSGFIRAISEILVKKNGVGIIATHSPVIVQEVPKKCVWIIRRIGMSVDVSHPDIETFGESLGTITNSIFGYEIEDTGFHNLIQDVVMHSNSYDEALKRFNGELGDEGKSILYSLMALKAQQND